MADIAKRRTSPTKQGVSPSAAAPEGGSVGAPQLDDGIEEMKYIRLLWYRRYLIILVTLAFIGLGIMQVRRAVPIYTSEVVLKFEPSGGRFMELGERSSMIYQRDEIRTAVQLIRSPAIATAVLEAIGTQAVAEQPADPTPLGSIRARLMSALRSLRSKMVSYAPTPNGGDRLQEQNAALGLLASVSVYQQPDTKLIYLRVNRTTPQEAERLAHEFAVQFIQSVQEEKRQAFSYTREYLVNQIEDTKAKLELAENAVFDYSGQADIRLMEETRSLAISTLLELTSQLEAARSEYDVLQAEFRSAAATVDQQVVLDPPQIIGDLSTRRNQLLDQRRALEGENQADFRPLNLVNQQLEALDKQLAEAISDYKVKYIAAREVALENAKETINNLRARLSEKESDVASLEQKMIRFRVLQREVDARRQIFDTLLGQYNRIDVLDDVTPNNVTIVAEATIPEVPSSPNVTRTLTTFTLFGGFSGCALVFLLFWMDRSVKSPELVEARLNLPSLAVLPFLRKPSSRFRIGKRVESRVLLATDDEAKNRGGAEAFRYLRTSINYSAYDGRHQVLLVTSGSPQEGKSTVAANLGVYYSELGEKVVVVDADLKRPSQHKIFGFARVPGVSDVLTRQCELKDAVVSSNFPGVDVLPAGFNAPSTTALLESDAMKRLLEALREQYTIVILDTSPADGMADALVLATLADAIVLVVKQGYTQMETLNRVYHKLQSIGGNVIGAVYNNTRPSGAVTQGGSPYYYYYYTPDES